MSCQKTIIYKKHILKEINFEKRYFLVYVFLLKNRLLKSNFFVERMLEVVT